MQTRLFVSCEKIQFYEFALINQYLNDELSTALNVQMANFDDHKFIEILFLMYKTGMSIDQNLINNWFKLSKSRIKKWQWYEIARSLRNLIDLKVKIDQEFIDIWIEVTKKTDYKDILLFICDMHKLGIKPDDEFIEKWFKCFFDFSHERISIMTLENILCVLKELEIEVNEDFLNKWIDLYFYKKRKTDYQKLQITKVTETIESFGVTNIKNKPLLETLLNKTIEKKPEDQEKQIGIIYDLLNKSKDFVKSDQDLYDFLTDNSLSDLPIYLIRKIYYIAYCIGKKINNSPNYWVVHYIMDNITDFKNFPKTISVEISKIITDPLDKLKIDYQEEYLIPELHLIVDFYLPKFKAVIYVINATDLDLQKAMQKKEQQPLLSLEDRTNLELLKYSGYKLITILDKHINELTSFKDAIKDINQVVKNPPKQIPSGKQKFSEKYKRNDSKGFGKGKK